jgi:hypothetical protein
VQLSLERPLSLEHGESGEGTVVAHDLDVDTVGNDLTILLELMELLLGVLGETKLDAGSNLLAAGELEHRSSEGLLGVLNVVLINSDGHENGADVNTGGSAVGLTPSLSHTGGKSIGAGARELLVDSENVPRVHSHSHVESILTGLGLHVLVSSNTGSFERLRGELLLLTGDEMDTVGELVVESLLSTDVVNSELGVRDTSVVARLRIRLVLLVSIAARWSSSHFI